jgi:hypothetical protein
MKRNLAFALLLALTGCAATSPSSQGPGGRLTDLEADRLHDEMGRAVADVPGGVPELTRLVDVDAMAAEFMIRLYRGDEYERQLDELAELLFPNGVPEQ